MNESDKKVEEKDGNKDDEETLELGSFNFTQNFKAHVGCSYTEGKHVDEGPPYKSILEEQGLDKIHITKAEYMEMHSTRDKMRGSYLTQVSQQAALTTGREVFPSV